MANIGTDPCAIGAAGITWAAATALPASIAAPYQPVKVGGLWIVAGPQTTYYTSTDGVAWTTIQSEAPTAVSGEWTWYDLNTSIAAPYFRVLATSGTLWVTELV